MRAACGQTDLMARILVGVSGRHRRLQGGRAGAPRHRRRPLGARDPDAHEPALRGQGDLRGRDGGARAGGRVRARPRARSVPGEPVPDHSAISHLELVRRCDVFCIAPASANTIAKLAGGLADNLLTSAALASPAPLVLAPAMNDRMYEHPATQENLERLEARGMRIVPPGTGRLASKGEWGTGGLAEPADILTAIEATPEPARSPRVRSTGCGCSSRQAARARRSTRCATSELVVGTHGPGTGRGGLQARSGGHADLRERDPRHPSGVRVRGRDERRRARGRSARRVSRD